MLLLYSEFNLIEMLDYSLVELILFSSKFVFVFPGRGRGSGRGIRNHP